MSTQRLYQEDAMTELGKVLTKEPKPVLRLYEIPDAYERIEDALIEAGGIMSDELEAELNALDGAFEDKVERICRIIRSNDATAKALKEEEDRLYARKLAHENTSKRLKKYLKDNMDALGRLKVSAGIFKVAIQRNSQSSIRWTGTTEEIPAGLRRVTIEFSPSKAQELLDAGEELPEGVVVEHGSHLRVR